MRALDPQAAEVREAILGGSARTHLVGVGNDLRGDDAAGLVLASKLRRALGQRPLPNVTIHPRSLAPELLISRLCSEGSRVVILDAVEARVPPGRVVAAKVSDTKYGFFATHNIPLKLVPGVQGGDVWVVGVQPGSVEFGEALTPTVKASVDALADEIVTMVRELL